MNLPGVCGDVRRDPYHVTHVLWDVVLGILLLSGLCVEGRHSLVEPRQGM